jgi:hypothetical protein
LSTVCLRLLICFHMRVLKSVISGQTDGQLKVLNKIKMHASEGVATNLLCLEPYLLQFGSLRLR